MSTVVQLVPKPATPPTDPDALYASLVARAVALSKGSVSGADALVADVALSALPPSTFKPLAAAIAKATGWDATALAAQMADGRKAVAPAAGGPAAPRGMSNPDPAPNPVPLERAFDQMMRAIQRQVVCDFHAAVAIVLWSAGTYGFQGASIYPRMVFTSATKRCGKSTALGTVRCFVSRPVKADNVSASAVFRLIANRKPTLLIDEVDTFFSRNEELRNVANAGYERSGNVLRSVPTPDGKSFTEASFNVFCPVALAGIETPSGRLPDTVLDRAIVVKLERAAARSTGQRQAPMRHRELEQLRDILAPNLVAHAAAIETTIEAGLKTLPQGLSDRAQDNWEPLIALADLAGGPWPQRARVAALALSGGEDAPSKLEMLLADLRPLVDAERRAAVQAWLVWVRAGRAGKAAGQKGSSPAPRSARHLRSTEAVIHLIGLEDRPWPEYGKDGKGLSPHRLAALLNPLGITPSKHRLPARQAHVLNPSGTETVAAYSIPALRRAFRRYLA